VVENLPSKYKALNSNPITAKKKFFPPRILQAVTYPSKMNEK
jgi:hypothetical protein